MNEDEELLMQSQLTIHRQLNPNYPGSSSGIAPSLTPLALKAHSVHSDGDISDSEKCWERPGNVVAKRNARERTRVHTVNQAFQILKSHLPTLRSHTKRVSKLKILKAAINYIDALLDLLKTAETASHTSRRLTGHKSGGLSALSDRQLGGAPLPYVNMQTLLDCQQYIYPPPAASQQSLLNPFVIPSSYPHH